MCLEFGVSKYTNRTRCIRSADIVRVALIVSDSYHHYSGSDVLITLLIGLLTSGDKKLYRLVATGPSLLSSLLNELIDRAASELVVISADRNLPIRTLTSHLPDSSYRKIITPLNLKFGLIEHFEMHFISDLQKVTFKLHFPSKARESQVGNRKLPSPLAKTQQHQFFDCTQ